MPDPQVPEIVIGRLPLYLRALTRMTESGKEFTSSHELGQLLGISSAQIRKDFSHFGEFGKQGTGYHIAYLTEQLRRILNVEQLWDVALVGVGDLGRAIAHYRGFMDRGFRITALYDTDPDKIGLVISNLKVKSISIMVADIIKNEIKIAMLSVPFAVAQETTDLLVKAGIKAILSYAPISMNVPEDVHVEYIDPVSHLQKMTHFIK